MTMFCLHTVSYMGMVIRKFQFFMFFCFQFGLWRKLRQQEHLLLLNQQLSMGPVVEKVLANIMTVIQVQKVQTQRLKNLRKAEEKSLERESLNVIFVGLYIFTWGLFWLPRTMSCS